MSKAYSLTPAMATAMLAAYASTLGASPKLRFYDGTAPASAATALSSNTKLAEMVCASTPISGNSDTGTVIRATFAAIASAIAIASGTATFYRIVSSDGLTTYDQGTLGITSDFDITLSTVALTAGSTVTVSSLTRDFGYLP